MTTVNHIMDLCRLKPGLEAWLHFILLLQMFEEGPLWAGGGAAAFHHQSGAVRPAQRSARHHLCHHVRSAGTVCVSASVLRCDRKKWILGGLDSTWGRDRCVLINPVPLSSCIRHSGWSEKGNFEFCSSFFCSGSKAAYWF